MKRTKKRVLRKSPPTADQTARTQNISAILQDRRAAATAVGACLLLAMFLFLVVATFLGLIKPDIIASAFTLVLGYFFGQIGSIDE